MPPDDTETLTIVIPTYNESENLNPLFRELSLLDPQQTDRMEILLVDDNSPDGTAFIAPEIGRKYGLRVRVLTREEKLGLGSAIGAGIGEATGDLVCVMDADLSHPPSLVTTLRDALGSADGVVASRYIPGGSVVNWPHRRKVISRVATSMARLLFRPPCQDPLSGFFLFRRSSIGNVRITGLGNKPLLEILVQGFHPSGGALYLPEPQRGEEQARREGDSRICLCADGPSKEDAR